MKIVKPFLTNTKVMSSTSSIKAINIKQSHIPKKSMVNLLSTQKLFNIERSYNSIPYVKSEPEYFA
jgi:hypothetical protein